VLTGLEGLKASGSLKLLLDVFELFESANELGQWDWVVELKTKTQVY
jgi:hypothetical protein